MPPFRSPDCSVVVFRSVLFEKWIQRKKNATMPSLRWQAFKRLQKDTDGVTIWFDKESSSKELENPTFGDISIHVGRVRDCSTTSDNLDVVQDSSNHGFIDGIPYVWNLPEGSPERMDLERRMMDCCREIVVKAARLCED
jgi:hypothetical protein